VSTPHDIRFALKPFVRGDYEAMLVTNSAKGRLAERAFRRRKPNSAKWQNASGTFQPGANVARTMMAERKKLEVNNAFSRFLTKLRELNEAGEISGLSIVAFHEGENYHEAGRSGYVPQRRRVEDIDRLTRAVEQDLNLDRVLVRGMHRRSVPEPVKRRNGLLIGELNSLNDQGLIEGFCAVVYGADGGGHAFSMIEASLSSALSALGALADVARGEDGIVASFGCLNTDFLFAPAADVDRRARAIGESLIGPHCSRCGEPTRLVGLSPADSTLPENRDFACWPCKTRTTIPAERK
jgi:hypothetical protein